MERCKEIETVDDNELETEWQDNVYIGAEYAERRQEILDKLGKFQ